MQFYFDKIKQLTVNRSNSIVFRQSLTSLATTSGIQPLVPFFTYFIADEVRIFSFVFQNIYQRIEAFLSENSILLIKCYDLMCFPQVTRSLTNFPLLFALMRVARSLLQNPHLHIELYVSVMSLYRYQLLILSNLCWANELLAGFFFILSSFHTGKINTKLSQKNLWKGSKKK